MNIVNESNRQLSRRSFMIAAGAMTTAFSGTPLLTTVSAEASSNADTVGLHCGGIELFVGDRANLRYVNLQDWGQKLWHFSHQKAKVGRITIESVREALALAIARRVRDYD